MFLRNLLFNNFQTVAFHPLKRLFSRALLSYENPLLKNIPVSNFCTESPGGEGDVKHEMKSYRHEYPFELGSEVNHQILAEFNASMVYLSMSCYYGRTDVALPGCQSYFRMMFNEEMRHANVFINYQMKRGGVVRLYPITTPENFAWTDITVALGVALELEKRVKEQLECLYVTAENFNDIELMELLSSKFIVEQNESIWEMGRLLTRAKRLVDNGGIGRYLFDQSVYAYVEKKSPSDLVPIYM